MLLNLSYSSFVRVFVLCVIVGLYVELNHEILKQLLVCYLKETHLNKLILFISHVDNMFHFNTSIHYIYMPRGKCYKNIVVIEIFDNY